MVKFRTQVMEHDPRNGWQVEHCGEIHVKAESVVMVETAWGLQGGCLLHIVGVAKPQWVEESRDDVFKALGWA